MTTRIIPALTTALVCTGLGAHATLETQDPGTVRVGKPRGAAAVSLEKARISTGVHATAAAAQLVSIKMALAQMMGELWFSDRFDGFQDPKERAELVAHGEQEALQTIADQLDQFILTYADAPQAEAARAMAVRVQLRLGHAQAAAELLREFDPEAAGVSDILAMAMSVPLIGGIEARIPELLEVAVARAPSLEQQFDAVFVAVRLGYLPVAKGLIEAIEVELESVEEKARFLVAEAELVSRLSREIAIAAENIDDGPPVIIVDPISEFGMSPYPRAIDDLRPRATDAVAGAPEARRLEEASAARAALLGSPLFASIAEDAAHGLQMLAARVRQTGFAPVRLPLTRLAEPPAAVPDYLPSLLGVSPADVVIAGLLHEVAHFYPGTVASRIAAAKLRAYSLEAGAEPIPIRAPTSSGETFTLSDKVGQVVLIDFWATSNQDSMRARPQLARLYHTYRHAGLEVVSVSLDTADDRWVAEIINEFTGATWAQIFEGQGSHSLIARAYAVDALPARVLIGRDGRVFEARPERLTPEALPTAIAAALRERPTAVDLDSPTFTRPPDISDGLIYFGSPRPERVGEGGIVVHRPQIPSDDRPIAGRAPDSDAPAPRDVEVDAIDYAGPPFEFELRALESNPVQYTLTATTVVPSGGYELRHDYTTDGENGAEVFFSLVAPAPGTPVTAVLEELTATVQLGPVEDSVRVFVRHLMRDVYYFVAPTYQFVEQIDIEDSPRPAYVGPELTAQLFSTRSIPAQHTLAVQVATPDPGYTLALVEMREGGGATQVLLRLTAPQFVAQRVAEPTAVRIDVPLGTDVGPRVEILVDYSFGPARPPEFALAKVLSTN